MIMRADKARVLEYSDGTTYVYPYSGDDDKSIIDMAHDIMHKRDVIDLNNNYTECSIQLLRSEIYNNVKFIHYGKTFGNKRCHSDDGIGNNCSNCEKCIILNGQKLFHG